MHSSLFSAYGNNNNFTNKTGKRAGNGENGEISCGNGMWWLWKGIKKTQIGMEQDESGDAMALPNRNYKQQRSGSFTPSKFTSTHFTINHSKQKHYPTHTQLQNSSGNNHGKSIRIHVDNADM
jgi:hypothetical protein